MCGFWKKNYMNAQIIPNLLLTGSWSVSSATETQCWHSPAAAPWWKSVAGGFSSAHPALGNRWSGSGTCSPCRTCASGPPEGLSPEQWASFPWTQWDTSPCAAKMNIPIKNINKQTQRSRIITFPPVQPASANQSCLINTRNKHSLRCKGNFSPELEREGEAWFCSCVCYSDSLPIHLHHNQK